jgi:hypothetical protein
MDNSIGDFLNDEPTAEVETPTAEPTQETAEQQTEENGLQRDERGRFKSKDETGVETPQPAEVAAAEPVPPTEQPDRLPQAEYAALRDERRKRQELEQRLAAIEAAQTQRQPEPQQPPVDFWDDPQSFMDARMNQLGQTLLQQWEQRETAKRLDQSEQAARSKYADYDNAFAAFQQAVQTNPQLAYELASSDNPGEYAYRKGKTALTLSSVGSLEEYEAQLRAKWEAEVRAAVPQPRVTLPSTTAADQTVAGRGAPVFAGPTPISDILGR